MTRKHERAGEPERRQQNSLVSNRGGGNGPANKWGEEKGRRLTKPQLPNSKKTREEAEGQETTSRRRPQKRTKHKQPKTKKKVTPVETEENVKGPKERRRVFDDVDHAKLTAAEETREGRRRITKGKMCTCEGGRTFSKLGAAKKRGLGGVSKAKVRRPSDREKQGVLHARGVGKSEQKVNQTYAPKEKAHEDGSHQKSVHQKKKTLISPLNEETGQKHPTQKKTKKGGGMNTSQDENKKKKKRWGASGYLTKGRIEPKQDIHFTRNGGGERKEKVE